MEACSQEVRAVERRTLLETLAKRLPPSAISFSSKLETIEKGNKGDTLLTLEDDTVISAKVASSFATVISAYGIYFQLHRFCLIF